MIKGEAEGVTSEYALMQAMLAIDQQLPEKS